MCIRKLKLRLLNLVRIVIISACCYISMKLFIKSLLMQKLDTYRVWSGFTVSSGKRIWLTEYPWIITNGHNLTINGTVPGNVHTALLKNNIIDNPYYRDNDLNLKWIVRLNWTYSLNFSVSLKNLADFTSFYLVCNGLDTVSSVYLNTILLGTTDNMFVRYTYEIRNILKDGSNIIRIVFESPVEYAIKQAKKSSYPIGIYTNNAPPNGESNRQYIRKEQASFSWDLGPSFPTIGIWKDIYIQCFTDVSIRDLCVVPVKEGDTWHIDVDVYFDISDEVSGTLKIELVRTSLSMVVDITITPNNKHIKLKFPIPKNTAIELWWPNGYGDQIMYNLMVSFINTKTNKELKKYKGVGFRTVKLIQEKVSPNSNHGLTFFFEINGIPLFLKGSNWIPADSFQDRVTKDKVRCLLQSVVDANMNCLRVWGGGVYESDEFYDIADELGIMIWQDLMFSVNLYPVDRVFLRSVEEEVTYQVLRLKNHPCIIVWAGNNENEVGLQHHWYPTFGKFQVYAKDYATLYIDTIKPIIERGDKSREYLISSPSNGKLTDQSKNGISPNPDNSLYGDNHYYSYGGDMWDPKRYPTVRMCTEYGLQSYCSFEALQDVFKEDDLQYDSAMLDHHQRHVNGKREMKAMCENYMKFPNSPDEIQRLKDIIYMTQIFQAVAIQAETEHYRRCQNYLDSSGHGLTMGAMYWQLNDEWPAPTWASIDYNLKWKMLHYYMAHTFSPVLISPYLDLRGDVDVYIVVDQIPIRKVVNNTSLKMEFRPITEASELNQTSNNMEKLLKTTKELIEGTLVIEMYLWSKFEPLQKWEVPYKLNTTSESVYKRNLLELIKESYCPNIFNCFLYIYIKDKQEHRIPSSWLRMSDFKQAVGLQKPKLQITSVLDLTSKRQEFEIVLTTNRIAPFVWLDSHRIPGRFSENGFLMKDPTKTVTFFAWGEVSKDILMQTLTVKSLMDVYM